MNKKLLAVAVAGAFAAPAVVFAQSSVTLYGSADVAYISKIHKARVGGDLSKTLGLGEGLHAGNRIGFRGSEDLGGGLSAQFVIEQGINLTNGALFGSRAGAAGQQYDGLSAAAGGNNPSGSYTTGTNRQAFVGLKGSWGELLAGYQYTTLYRVSTLGGYFVGTEGAGGGVSHGILDLGNFGGTRANGFTYNSPKFSDFQLTVQRGATGGREDASFATAAGNNADNKTENDAHRWSLMLNYAKGPFSVTLGHTKLTTDVSAVAANLAACPVNVFGACTATSIAASAQVDSSARLTQLGASYRLGGWKFMGTYANGRRSESVGATNIRSKSYSGGLEYTGGAFRPFITLGRANSDTTTTGAQINHIKDQQFGLRYDLSKRTLLYVMTGSTKDSATASAVSKRQFTGAGMYMSF